MSVMRIIAGFLLSAFLGWLLSLLHLPAGVGALLGVVVGVIAMMLCLHVGSES